MYDGWLDCGSSDQIKHHIMLNELVSELRRAYMLKELELLILPEEIDRYVEKERARLEAERAQSCHVKKTTELKTMEPAKAYGPHANFQQLPNKSRPSDKAEGEKNL